MRLVLLLLVIWMIGGCIVWWLSAPKPRHQKAYCFVGSMGSAYPCGENPHWRADI
jgi:hypothetical protein